MRFHSLRDRRHRARPEALPATRTRVASKAALQKKGVTGCQTANTHPLQTSIASAVVCALPSGFRTVCKSQLSFRHWIRLNQRKAVEKKRKRRPLLAAKSKIDRPLPHRNVDCDRPWERSAIDGKHGRLAVRHRLPAKSPPKPDGVSMLRLNESCGGRGRETQNRPVSMLARPTCWNCGSAGAPKYGRVTGSKRFRPIPGTV